MDGDPSFWRSLNNSTPRLFGGQFLVTLLSGFPFPPCVAQVRIVDPHTGDNQTFITGLTSAIDVLPVKTPGGGNEFLTLEFSTNQLAQAQGRLQLFTSPGGPPVVIANCLITPTSMALDPKTGSLFVTEIFTGRIVEVAVATKTLDKFLKRLSDIEEEFTFMKADLNRVKAVLREKLGFVLD